MPEIHAAGRRRARNSSASPGADAAFLTARLPMLIGIDAGPYTGVTKAVVSAVVGVRCTAVSCATWWPRPSANWRRAWSRR